MRAAWIVTASLITSPGVGVAAPFLVVIDPGHDPAEPGAIGTTGVAELIFNDRLTTEVAAHLGGHSELRVAISRAPGALLKLADRAREIDALSPDLVVSLHHDSVKPEHLSWRTEAGILLPTCNEYRGYSIFAQGKGPHRRASQRFATAVADNYRALGLRHTTYHALPPPGEHRKWIDAERGIHAGDYLYILRKIDAPVVLVESGFVVNPEDERQLRDPKHRDQLAAAIAAAVFEVAGIGRKNSDGQKHSSGATFAQPTASIRR